MGPNILLVVLDALRRDAIEPHGAPPGSTPVIAELARRGASLPHAYSTGSWTLPAHASMFAGLLPRRLGLGQAPGGSPQSARPALERVSDRLVANVLRGAGYATHAFSTNLWVSNYAGFDIGFDSFAYSGDHRTGAGGAMLGAGLRSQLAWAIDGLRARSDDGAAEMRNLLTDSIDRWSGQPTFWFVNLCECHSPYLPPRPWNDLPPRARVQAALEAQRHLSFEAICLYAAGRHDISDEAFQRMRYLYGRSAAYVDQWLGDVLESLDRRGILDDTLVIVTSDHGENFGEGGLIAHGFSIDERLIHVPFVSAGPGAMAAGEGAVPASVPFSLAELPRILGEAAGISPHPWQRDELPSGVAIAQYDPMVPADHRRIHEFASRWRLDEHAVERLTAGFSGATDGRRKLVVRDGIELLYDLESDPDETAPLDAGAANGAFEPLRAALRHPAAVGAAAIGGADPGAGASGSGPGPASQEELAAIERQMRVLGYL
jgi:arylsulfatase A-like enzyme